VEWGGPGGLAGLAGSRPCLFVASHCQVGKRTPVFTRFSTVGGEKGSADTERDPRGFAIKFFTEEGNYDMVRARGCLRVRGNP
jgi:hypothetical protein